MPTSLLNGTLMPAHWGLTFWGMLFTQSLVLISFHFFYRYCLVCQFQWLTLFNSWKYVPLWVGIWALMGLSCAATLHFFMYHTPAYQTAAMSEKLRSLQYDFFKALLVQTLIPTIFEYIPFLVIFSSPLLSRWIAVGRWANFVPTAVSFYPMIDPICIIYFIKDYRFALMRRIKRIKRNNNTIGIAYTTNATSEKPGSSALQTE
ncbi:unnamed protein product, partial [Mesorhabditis belari]|uniref:Uncharacterized protein n=1 Tax=Mesorhabditis belari TaxID=2138241 RepID=A0AAF3FGH5_9BILA